MENVTCGQIDGLSGILTYLDSGPRTRPEFLFGVRSNGKLYHLIALRNVSLARMCVIVQIRLSNPR
jgi:hypothetical protein